MSYAFTCRPEFFDEGVLRYGFHGLSYESLVHQLGDTLPGKAIFAHLGNGASVTAVLQRQVDRHQHGLTPTGGIPHGHAQWRPGHGVLLFLQRSVGMDTGPLGTAAACSSTGVEKSIISK